MALKSHLGLQNASPDLSGIPSGVLYHLTYRQKLFFANYSESNPRYDLKILSRMPRLQT
jgi:hypothetical protein